jgi:hypothetical protein
MEKGRDLAESDRNPKNFRQVSRTDALKYSQSQLWLLGAVERMGATGAQSI